MKRAEGATGWRIRLSAEALMLLTVFLITLAANGLFWRQVLTSEEAGQGLVRLGFVLTLGVLVGAAHLLLLLPVSHRLTLKPVLMLTVPVTVAAAFYMYSYTVFLDPSMLRNVLHTQVKEARELVNLKMLLVVSGLSLPLIWLLSRVELIRYPWRRALWRRLLLVLALFAMVIAVLLPSYQRLSALMRNQHELRYLVTPANLLVSVYRVLRTDVEAHKQPRLVIDPTPSLNSDSQAKPRLLVLVLGETVRAANWGLAGYARQTTPELAKRDVIAFNDVAACGTSTEVSVPCLFSRLGRHAYDETHIHREESLLHLLARAGVPSVWIDNQTGCKGVCDGLDEIDVRGDENPARCRDGVCLDEVMLDEVERQLATPAQTQVIVLHMLGNHGPAYWQRYPKAFAQFQPECKTVNLADCSSRSISNSYDNAILYTDSVLARLIDRLGSVDDRDTALVYVSDHGESLGEGGLYLHGVPYMIAPAEQLKVPMVWWLSSALKPKLETCLQAQASRAQSHDVLFHSLLSLLQVKSTTYQVNYDLLAGCAGQG